VLIGCSGLLQEVLARILDETDFQLAASAASVDQLALIDTRQFEAILLVVDARQDAEAAIMQVQLFKQLHPGSRVAVLTETDRMDDLTSLYLAGTNVCFSNGATLEIFLKSVELAMLGETLLPSTLLAYVRHREFAPDPEPAFGGSVNLSAQEDRILRNLAEGHSNKIIARRLGIAEATVKVHVKSILCKIGAHNRTQAAVWAMENASLGRQAEGLEIGNA
jgi:DNA-binding NarL/FixJ family response regulator